MWRLARLLVALALLAGGSLLILRWREGMGAPPPLSPSRAAAPSMPAPPAVVAAACTPAPAFTAAAAANAASETTSAWSLFGRPETGWAIYAPLVAHEIGTGCPADQPGFAAALASWQQAHALPSAGVMDSPTLDALRIAWLMRRPFTAETRGGACPPAAAPADLVQARADEGYEAKPIQLNPGALSAWRAMIAAARAQSPEIAADRRLLTIFSGFRSPDADTAHCDAFADCGTPARAHCSAHRTGTAMDLYLGAAPGFPPESSADENRLYQARSPAYLWLVANAARFGLVPYPFEPWHWEWAGQG